MKTALVILAEGFEEIEAVTVIDILRRAEIRCTIAALHDGKFVTGKTGIQIVADELFESVRQTEFDLIVLPGGPGTRHLRKHKSLLNLLRHHSAQNRLIGAICAAPLALSDAGLLNNRKFTAHFSTKNELPNLTPNQSSVSDGNIITSPGAGTALTFSLKLVESLRGTEISEEIRKSICAA